MAAAELREVLACRRPRRRDPGGRRAEWGKWAGQRARFSAWAENLDRGWPHSARLRTMLSNDRKVNHERIHVAK